MSLDPQNQSPCREPESGSSQSPEAGASSHRMDLLAASASLLFCSHLRRILDPSVASMIHHLSGRLRWIRSPARPEPAIASTSRPGRACAMIALPALCGAAPGEIVRLRRNDSGVHGARQSTMVNAAVRRAAGHSAPPKASRCADTSVRMARSVSVSTSLVRTPTYTNIYDRRLMGLHFSFSWANWKTNWASGPVT